MRRRSTGRRTASGPPTAAISATRATAPLDQIDASNFNRLEIAWRFKADNLGPNREYNFQSTPLMVDGVVYSTAGSRRAVVALDAGNGELLWIHRLDEGQRGQVAPRQLSGRGLAYWENGDDKRIIYVTPGYQMIALDARTGDRVEGFGEDGIVDLKQNDRSGPRSARRRDRSARDADRREGRRHRRRRAPRPARIPTSARNVRATCAASTRAPASGSGSSTPIPMRGEFGTESWLRGSAEYTGNTGVWAQISVDEELETVYLPVEEATGDYYGADRPGDNLFGETLLAVDLNTGERKWHFQLVHHGIWDYDIPCAPILFDAVVDGRTVKAVAQPTKQAFLYVFDRVTGEPALADRGAARAGGRRAGRVVLADAAVPDEAAGVRPSGHDRERPHRFHAGAAPRGARGRRRGTRWGRCSRRPSSATSTARSAR